MLGIELHALTFYILLLLLHLWNKIQMSNQIMAGTHRGIVIQIHSIYKFLKCTRVSLVVISLPSLIVVLCCEFSLVTLLVYANVVLIFNADLNSFCEQMIDWLKEINIWKVKIDYSRLNVISLKLTVTSKDLNASRSYCTVIDRMITHLLNWKA